MPGQGLELLVGFVDLGADAVDPDRLEEVVPEAQLASIDPAALGLESAVSARDARVVPDQVEGPWAVWFAGLEDAVDRGQLEAAAATESVSIDQAVPDQDSAV